MNDRDLLLLIWAANEVLLRSVPEHKSSRMSKDDIANLIEVVENAVAELRQESKYAKHSAAAIKGLRSLLLG